MAIPSSLRSALWSAGFIVDLGEDEVTSVIKENESLDRADDEYLLTIMPSSYCQLGCSYCGQSHRKEKMAGDTEDATIALVTRQLSSRPYSHVNVTWYGGEPLIGLSTIRRLTPRLRQTADTIGARYQASVITNGMALSNKVALELVTDLSVTRIQVTLDGLEQTHDSRRFKKNGKGSFSRIIENLESLTSSEILHRKIHVRCNVDQRNANDVLLMIDLLSELGLAPLLGRFYIAGVTDWDNGAGKDAMAPDEFARLQLAMYERLLVRGMPIDELPARTTGMCKVYYQQDSPLVSQSGHLFNCYEYPLVESKVREPFARVGHVERNEEMSTPTTPTNVILSMRNDGHACLTCNVLPICGGVCEPHWQKGVRRCPGFKFNLGDWLAPECVNDFETPGFVN